MKLRILLILFGSGMSYYFVLNNDFQRATWWMAWSTFSLVNFHAYRIKP